MSTWGKSAVALLGALVAIEAGRLARDLAAPDDAPSPVSAARPSTATAPRVRALGPSPSRGAAPLAPIAPADEPATDSSHAAPELDRTQPAIARRLDDALAQQQRDSAWSSDTEHAIADVFTDEALQQSRLVSSECRSTFCRVQIRHDDAGAQEDGIEHLHQKPPFNTNGFILRTGTVDAPEVVVYFSREGARLPLL